VLPQAFVLAPMLPQAFSLAQTPHAAASVFRCIMISSAAASPMSLS